MSKPLLLQKRQFTLNALGISNRFGSIKFGSSISSSYAQSDGKILVGGDFFGYAGINTRNRLIRLNSDGTVDAPFCVNASDGGKFNGTPNSIVVQSDGKILVGGLFANYAGTTGRNNFIRLNSDGTLDTAFCVNATDGTKFNSPIQSIFIQSDGKILVGGNFTNYAGTSGRSYLIRLNSDGTLDTAFCANATDVGKFNNSVSTIAVQSDGKVLVGGNFTNYPGGANRNRLIRLNSDGTVDDPFCVNASDSVLNNKFASSVTSVAVQSDGKILVGGAFINYAGTTNRNRFVRLNSDGTLDVPFCVNASDSSKFSGSPNSIVVQSDGKILVGGNFINYAGTTGRNILIRLNSDGTLDTAFCVNASDGGKFNANIRPVVIQSDGKVLVGGSFTNYPKGINRNRFIRLTELGVVDDNFCVNASDFNNGYFFSTIDSIAVQSDGKVLVGGNFTDYARITNRNRLLRLNLNGTLDTTFCVNASDGGKFNNIVNSVAIQSDGKVLVGGNFTDYAGTTNRNRLVRLNPDGTLDTAFCVGASDSSKFNSTVFTIATQSDGKVLVGGQFTNYAGTTNRNYLIRLNSDGTVDTPFCVNASDGGKFNSIIRSIVTQSDGKILVGGSFNNYAGTTNRSFLIRLNSDGTLDTAFCANASDGSKFNSTVITIAVQSDDKVLVGGQFIDYAGTINRNYLIRLNSDGTLDTAFCANASDGGLINNNVIMVNLQPNNQILVSGFFTERFKLLASDGTTVSVLPSELRVSSSSTYCAYTNNSIIICSSPVAQAYGALLVLDKFYNVI
jgi:uncharacterized delta-60 repeat protein